MFSKFQLIPGWMMRHITAISVPFAEKSKYTALSNTYKEQGNQRNEVGIQITTSVDMMLSFCGHYVLNRSLKVLK
jgi:hypothetical protein